MNKGCIVTLAILSLIVPLVLAVRFDTIKDVANTINQASEDYIIVVGSSNPTKDVVAAANFGKFIRDGFTNYKLDTEIDLLNFPEEYLIVIGGPCANTLWKEYSTFTCENWQYKETKGILELTEKNGKTILLIAGTTGDDTETITNRLVQTYDTDPLFTNSRVIIPFSEEEKSSVEQGTYLCGNGNCDM